MLTFLIGLGLLELAIYSRVLWPIRRLTGLALATAQLIWFLWLLGSHFNAWALLIAYIGLYRILSLMRLYEDRVEDNHLKRSCRLTSLYLISGQLIGLLLEMASPHFNIRAGYLLWLAVACSLTTVFALLVTARRRLKALQPPPSQELNEKDWPSVSVCVPARNETDDLTASLDSIMSSNYPKLEILVLDDCSQTKRTPEIIRGFASSGIKFIAGQSPPPNWLAKNYAYEQLAESASGDILIFCGVDLLLSPASLRNIVESMLAKPDEMISLMPNNQLPPGGLLKGLLQVNRYALEITFPWLKRPPLLSTCWAIKAKALTNLGGWQANTNSVLPEAYFAKRLGPNYGFYRASDFGLVSHKSYSQQLDTAIRTRYPQLHKRLEIVAALSLAETLLLIGPLAALILAIVQRDYLLLAASLIICGGLVATYAQMVRLTYGRFFVSSLLLLPLVAVLDIVILNYSMWRYEFKEVIWKGRNVCLPIMHQYYP